MKPAASISALARRSATIAARALRLKQVTSQPKVFAHISFYGCA